MNRARLEVVTRDSGVDRDVSDPIAAPDMGALSGGGSAPEDPQTSLVRRLRIAAWELDEFESAAEWPWLLAVADADIEDEFGDFCGRRVA